ncbi:HEAT repeat domain-containing protein [Actinoplanes subtropicus]|uniref:HEAT repeat domain-containing protein n=1 Tax=Actinoplanes subtropicus TaxID=543632 RepID=UPI0006900C2D|nr:HEAT repeat domain-containing protein [Actinoplanes subtropicus]
MRQSRLIELFRSTPDDDVKAEAVASLDEHAADPEVITFLTAVAADPGEYDLARIECMKILRWWPPPMPAARRDAGRAVAAALREDDELVRQHAAMSLGPYLDDPPVFEALTAAVLHDDDLDVRHSALAAVAEAGPADRRADLLRRLAGDAELGRAAARTLDSWGGRGTAPVADPEG